MWYDIYIPRVKYLETFLKSEDVVDRIECHFTDKELEKIKEIRKRKGKDYLNKIA